MPPAQTEKHVNDNNRPLIMVVDDETKIRRLIATNLERSGFDVMSAADGLLAVEIFMKSSPRPDLILLDVMMPGMDGLECAAKIRDIDAVPIIFITAKSDGTTKLRGFDLGADDYVTKPFSIEELIARIRAVLRRSQARNPNRKRASHASARRPHVRRERARGAPHRDGVRTP